MFVCSKNNIKLSFNEKRGTYQIHSNGFCWESQGRMPYVLIRHKVGKRYVSVRHSFKGASQKEFRQEENKIVAEYSGFHSLGKKLPFKLVCTASIEESNKVSFSIRAENETGLDIEGAYFPAPFQEKDGSGHNYAVDTMRQGLLLPDKYRKNFIYTYILTKYRRVINTGDCYQPFWGRVAGKHGYTAIADTPYDASMFSCYGKRSAFLNSVHWRSSLGKLAYERSVIFHFFDNGDYNTVAKNYRNYLVEKNALTTIQDKIEKNPKVAYLAGTPVLHHKILRNVQPKSKYYKKGSPDNQMLFSSFANRGKQIEKIKELGIDKLYLHTDGWGCAGYDNQHPYVLPPNKQAGGYVGMKELSETCERLGYRFGVHDQYRDFYFDCTRYNENFAVEQIDGSHPYCDIWDGGAHTWLCASKALDFVKETYESLEKNGVKIHGSYLDVFSVVAGDECFNKDHTVTRQESVAYRGECFNYLREKGIIVSSEDGSGLSMNEMDLVHHAPYAVRPQGGGKPVGIPVPITNLVYHDCVFVPWLVDGRDFWGIPDGDSGKLHCILNAQTPYLSPFVKKKDPIDDSELLDDETLQKSIEEVNEISAINAFLYDKELVSHKFLDKSLRRQQTVFSDGTTISVDFDKNTYEVKRG